MLKYPFKIIRVIKSRRMNYVGNAQHMGEIRIPSKILVRTCKKKRHAGIPRCRSEINIKLDLEETDCDDAD